MELMGLSGEDKKILDRKKNLEEMINSADPLSLKETQSRFDKIKTHKERITNELGKFSKPDNIVTDSYDEFITQIINYKPSDEKHLNKIKQSFDKIEEIKNIENISQYKKKLQYPLDKLSDESVKKTLIINQKDEIEERIEKIITSLEVVPESTLEQLKIYIKNQEYIEELDTQKQAYNLELDYQNPHRLITVSSWFDQLLEQKIQNKKLQIVKENILEALTNILDQESLEKKGIRPEEIKSLLTSIFELKP